MHPISSPPTIPWRSTSTVIGGYCTMLPRAIRRASPPQNADPALPALPPLGAPAAAAIGGARAPGAPSTPVGYRGIEVEEACPRALRSYLRSFQGASGYITSAAASSKGKIVA